MAARSALAMGDDGLPQRYQAGDFLPVSAGGTGGSTAAAAVTNLIGYQPARPSLVAQATFASQNGIGVGSGSTSNLGSLAFTATAPNVRVDAKATIVATTSNGAETVYAYVALFDTTGGAQNQVGTGVSRTTNVYYGNGGRDTQPTFVYSGLTPGRQYTAYFYAFQADNSCAVNVSAIEMAVSNT